ncbi:MAG: hypothetical protein R3D55_22020 [Chloroflexota bacterium]
MLDSVSEQVFKHAEYGLPGRPYISPRITRPYHPHRGMHLPPTVFPSMGVENPQDF